MKIKSILILTVTLLLVFMNSCKNGQKEIVIPKSKIQKMIDKKFPIQEDKIITSITIDTPVVYFKGQNVGLISSYNGFFLDKDVKGIVDFNGQVIYNKDDGSFYLSNFNLVNFTANKEDLSNDEALRSLISKLMNKYLENYPIYRLDRSKFKEKIAKLLIKDVQTKDENLILIIGL
jgi:hypothetical protein